MADDRMKMDAMAHGAAESLAMSASAQESKREVSAGAAEQPATRPEVHRRARSASFER